MIKYREGPLLELNFYFGSLPEQDALARVIRALDAAGARFAGEGLAHFGPDAHEPFSFSHEWPRQRVQFDLEDLDLVMADPDLRLVGVYMFDAGGMGQPNIAEFVGYMGISRQAARADRHPIGIDTNGVPFSPTPDQFDPVEAVQVGQRAYRRFLAVVKATRPAYAAILPAHVLQCPTDLRLGPTPYNFLDFYVGGNYLGARNVATIRQLYQGAHIETADSGAYVSCSPYFNPTRTYLPDDPERQAGVARLIGYASEQDG